MGGIPPFTAKVDDTVWNRMNEKLSPNPIPRCRPIPPFTFREERAPPMEVRMN